MSSLETRQELSRLASPYIRRKSLGQGKARVPWPRWYQPPIMPYGRQKSTSPRDLIAAACADARISVAEFKSERRLQEYVRPRQAVAYVLRRYRPDLSAPQIARLLGRSDHTTILHAVKQAEKLRRTCPQFAALVANLEGIANGLR